MLAKKWWVIYLTVPDGHPHVTDLYSEWTDKKKLLSEFNHGWHKIAILDILEAN